MVNPFVAYRINYKRMMSSLSTGKFTRNLSVWPILDYVDATERVILLVPFLYDSVCLPYYRWACDLWPTIASAFRQGFSWT